MDDLKHVTAIHESFVLRKQFHSTTLTMEYGIFVRIDFNIYRVITFSTLIFYYDFPSVVSVKAFHKQISLMYYEFPMHSSTDPEWEKNGVRRVLLLLLLLFRIFIIFDATWNFPLRRSPFTYVFVVYCPLDGCRCHYAVALCKSFFRSFSTHILIEHKFYVLSN